MSSPGTAGVFSGFSVTRCCGDNISTSLPEQTSLTRTRIQCFTGVITAVGTIEAQVALTELAVYALAVARTVVQCCADGLTAVRTSESSETSIVRKKKRLKRD